MSDRRRAWTRVRLSIPKGAKEGSDGNAPDRRIGDASERDSHLAPRSPHSRWFPV